jgi:3',5'-cyclic AMP phosphodiesterase CpdA
VTVPLPPLTVPALTVLHLSDTHFGTEQPPVVQALLQLAQGCAPDAIVVTGDLTQRATAAQFHSARRFLAQLPPVPTLVLPGNHDIALFDLWTRLLHPYRAYAAVAGAAAAPRLLLGRHLLVVAADTTRRWRHRHGTLGRAQIDAVAAQLAAAPAGAWRMVATHHPLRVRALADLVDRPRHHALALQRWAEAGAELLLAGHIHLPAVLPVAPGCWVVQAGTAVSHRLRPGVPNSINLLRQQPGTPCRPGLRQCQRWDYRAEAGRFELAETVPLGSGAPRCEPTVWANTQVNSAPSRKICAE